MFDMAHGLTSSAASVYSSVSESSSQPHATWPQPCYPPELCVHCNTHDNPAPCGNTT